MPVAWVIAGTFNCMWWKSCFICRTFNWLSCGLLATAASCLHLS